MAKKDYWNAPAAAQRQPVRGARTRIPELAGLLPVLYPGVFPNLAAYTKDRADLAAILLTGIPGGIVPGFQNSTGSTAADLLRLNMAIPPSARRARSASSAATWPASPTAAASSTTW